MDRATHLQWAKERAMVLVNRGQLAEAWAQLSEDMATHAELANHKAVEQIARLLLAGRMSLALMRQSIEAIR